MKMCVYCTTKIVCTFSRIRVVLHFRNAEDDLRRPAVISVARTGQHKQPELIIDPEGLWDATSGNHRIPLTMLARGLKHCNTLCNKMKVSGISKTYSDIPDTNLNTLVWAYKKIKLMSRIRYITGFLLLCRLLLQRQQIQDALHYTDRLGQVLRNHAAMDHCVYAVPYSSYLWHINRHHKLIH